MKKALKINVEKQTIESVEINDYKDIYAKIGNGCQLFEIPLEFENGDGLYCDEESLLRGQDIKGGFMMPDWRIPIVGNAIILGCDEEGDSISCKSTISEFEGKVKFFDAKTCQEYAKRALSQVQIKSW